MYLGQFTAWALAQGSVAKYQGDYLGECVSLINQYCWRVLGVPAQAWGNAASWGANQATLTYFDVVSDLQEGDILVYPAAASNGWAGHIEIYIGNGQSLSQNRNYDGKIKVAGRLTGQIRILRRKGTGSVVASTIPNADNYYGRYNKLMNQVRGRDIRGTGFSRPEFAQNIAGATDLQAIERISDSSEADEAHEWMRIGYIATKDNWQQQIYDRTAEGQQWLQERNAARDSEALAKTALVNSEQKVKDLSAQLATQSDDTKNLNAAGIALQWLIKRLGLK